MDRRPAEHPAALATPPPGDSTRGRFGGERDGSSAAEGDPKAKRAEGAPERPAAGNPDGKVRRILPRNWRVRSKLAAVLVVPAVAFLVLASINMVGQIRSAQEYGRGATIAEFGRQVTTLVHDLQGERDLSAGFIANGRQASNGPEIEKARQAQEKDPKVTIPEQNEGAVLDDQQGNVDRTLQAYRTAEQNLGDVGSQAEGKIETARTAI